MKRVSYILSLCFVGGHGFASSINMTLFSAAYNTPPNLNFQGFTRDRSTGLFYRSHWYQSKQVYEYATASDLQSDTGSTMTSLDDFHLGTYAVVRNGKYFSRSGNVTNSTLNRFDIASGNTEISQNFAGIDPTNGPATFDWGGYSTLNLFDDVTGLYMYGKDFSGNHIMNKLDDNLNLLSSYSFSGNTGADASFGYAFDIKGYLFTGKDFNDFGIQTRLNLATGLTTSVNFTLTGIPSPQAYISNAYYDDLADRLYIHTAYDYGTGAEGVYYVDNAAQAFGVVPEPTTIAALAGGMLMLNRRRRT